MENQKKPRKLAGVTYIPAEHRAAPNRSGVSALRPSSLTQPRALRSPSSCNNSYSFSS